MPFADMQARNISATARSSPGKTRYVILNAGVRVSSIPENGKICRRRASRANQLGIKATPPSVWE
jgi:hypothetical protein